MPEIIDPVFAKTSQNARFLLSENERFGLVFVKTGSINSGTAKVGEDSNRRKTYNRWDAGNSRDGCKIRDSNSMEAANGRDANNKTRKANSIAGAPTDQ